MATPPSLDTLPAAPRALGGERAGAALPRPFMKSLESVYAALTALGGGEVAAYIPELAKADPRHLAIAIATLDGAVYAVGDEDAAFTIQSVSKPFAYGAVLDRLGRKEMLTRVGVEPTGDAFNGIVLDEANRRPFNPMVNAGAIVVSSLYPGDTLERRSEAMLAGLSRFAGRQLSVDETVFRSEASTGYRNRAIAYLLLNSGMLDVDPEAALDTYFRQCSVLVTVKDLAVMAATLANGGINPKTGERAVLVETVPDILTVMLTCGMYDYAGQWAYEAGLPAKSGVSGAVMAVVPGQFGVAAFSPKLDRFGNSVRAVEACRQLSAMFSFHSYRQRVSGSSVKGRAWTGAELRSRRWRPAEERRRLDSDGDRIAVLEARGDLTMAAAERILRSAGNALAEEKLVIIDLKSVIGIDAGSTRLFGDFGRVLLAAGKTIMLTRPAEPGIMRRLMEEDGRLAPSFVLEESLDHALELAEDKVLAAAGIGPGEDLLPVAKASFLRGLAENEITALIEAVRPAQLSFVKGDAIVRQGDPSDAVYMIGSGSVTVELPAANGPATRISALGPGAIFGEMGLIDGAPRSADVVADGPAICWSLPVGAMRAHLQDHPKVMNVILTNLVTDLADRLRQSNRMIMSLR